MTGTSAALDWRLIGAVMAGLFFFGCAYAGLIYALRGKHQGYTSLLVVGGVLVTLAGIALISWMSALLTLAAFTASGLPMVIGDIAAYVIERERAIRTLREDISRE